MTARREIVRVTAERSLFFRWEDVECFPERANDLITVFRADDDGRLIGARIDGVRELPSHDALELRLSRSGPMDLLELLLLTEPIAAGESPYHCKAKYVVALTRPRSPERRQAGPVSEVA